MRRRNLQDLSSYPHGPSGADATRAVELEGATGEALPIMDLLAVRQLDATDAALHCLLILLHHKSHHSQSYRRCLRRVSPSTTTHALRTLEAVVRQDTLSDSSTASAWVRQASFVLYGTHSQGCDGGSLVLMVARMPALVLLGELFGLPLGGLRLALRVRLER